MQKQIKPRLIFLISTKSTTINHSRHQKLRSPKPQPLLYNHYKPTDLIAPSSTTTEWLFGNVATGEFTRNYIYQCFVKQKKIIILLGRPHQLSLPHCKIWRSSIFVGIFNEQLSHALFLKNQCEKFSFFFPEKPVQLIDFTRIVHVNVKNIFFLFFF
jgi:hypothetical protein